MIVIKPLVRENIYKLNKHSISNDKFNLLIVGGSQGANIFDKNLKNSVVNISKKFPIRVAQQTNEKNIYDLKDFYFKNNIENNIFSFDKNFTNIIKQADLCITRGGASTLAELTFLNIPCLVIPYPHAKDNHQYHNAMFYKNKDCCWILNQKDLKNNVLSNSLIKILDNKEEYIKKKTNMKKFSYQNSWNKINQKIVTIINEN